MLSLKQFQGEKSRIHALFCGPFWRSKPHNNSFPNWEEFLLDFASPTFYTTRKTMDFDASNWRGLSEVICQTILRMFSVGGNFVKLDKWFFGLRKCLIILSVAEKEFNSIVKLNRFSLCLFANTWIPQSVDRLKKNPPISDPLETIFPVWTSCAAAQAIRLFFAVIDPMNHVFCSFLFVLPRALRRRKRQTALAHSRDALLLKGKEGGGRGPP